MALLGGETAEMSGFYAKDEYDIAGFCVGAVDRDKMITGEKVEVGDVLIGLPSSGVHSNGFSLVRKIVLDKMNYNLKTYVTEFNRSLGEELLTPTRLYPKVVLPLIERFDIHGMVHITGGGFYDNIPRVLPQQCGALVHTDAWEMPAVFKKLQENVDGDHIRTGHQNNIAKQCIDQLHVRHDLVGGHLHSDTGNQGCDKKQIPDQSVSRKTETVQNIPEHGTHHHGYRNDHDHDQGGCTESSREALGGRIAFPHLSVVFQIQPVNRRCHGIGGGIFIGSFE